MATSTTTTSSKDKGKGKERADPDAHHSIHHGDDHEDAEDGVVSKDFASALERDSEAGRSNSRPVSRTLSPIDVPFDDDDDFRVQRQEQDDEQAPHPCDPSSSSSSAAAHRDPTWSRKLPPALTKLVARLPSASLTLENSGSVARDHLASERTFLAYVRTSLAISSAGVGAYFVFLSLSFLFLLFPFPVAFSFSTSFSSSPPFRNRHSDADLWLGALSFTALVQLFTIATARAGPAGQRIQQFARPLGAVTILLGLVVLVIGTRITRPSSLLNLL